jgi:hypothetical protein
LPRDVPRDPRLSLDQNLAALDDVDRLIASYMEATGHMHRQPSEQN